MIDRTHELPVTRQAELLNISRGSVYYLPRALSAADLALMRRIDTLHLEHPFMGARMAARRAASGGLHRRAQTRGDPHAAHGRGAAVPAPAHDAQAPRAPGLSVPAARPGDRARQPGLGSGPHLHPDGAWVRLPGGGGRLGLAPGARAPGVDLDGEPDFCCEALEEALTRYGTPEIVNTDQGSQFTSAEFTDLLKQNGIAISMDGKGAWRDNVFVERLWRSVKYEEVYLKAYASVSEARTNLSRYFDFYNTRRPHSRLDGRTPDEFYFASLQTTRTAA